MYVLLFLLHCVQCPLYYLPFTLDTFFFTPAPAHAPTPIPLLALPLQLQSIIAPLSILTVYCLLFCPTVVYVTGALVLKIYSRLQNDAVRGLTAGETAQSRLDNSLWHGLLLLQS